jgi:CRP-like cAMP-binding protein
MHTHREVFLTVIQTDELIIHHINDVNSDEAIIRRRNRIAKSLLKLSEISALPFDRLRRLIFQLQSASFERGKRLYTEGKCTTRIMVIDKGFIDVEVRGEDGINRKNIVLKGMKLEDISSSYLCLFLN